MASNPGQGSDRDITQQAFDSNGNPVDLSAIRKADRDRLLDDMGGNTDNVRSR